MVYWLIAAKVLKTDKANGADTWKQIQQQILSGAFTASATGKQIEIQKELFKLGNLDQLMYQNDQMVKLDGQIESLLRKIERQLLDLDDQGQKHEFLVNTREGDMSLDKYLTNFKWDDSKYTRNGPINETIKQIQNRMLLVESDIRKRTQEYQEAKNEQNQLAKKEGNLYTKDLVDVLKHPICEERDFVQSQYLTTLVAIVPQYQIEQFTQNYQNFSNNIVPGSAKQFKYEDKDGLTLWRLVACTIDLENKNQQIQQDKQDNKDEQKKNMTVAERIIASGRDHKFTLKEFVYKKEESQLKEERRIKINDKTKKLTGQLKDSCHSTFGELYTAYLHLKNLRFIVDIAMRFGLKEQLLTFLIQPYNGKDKKVQQILIKLFADPSQISLYGTKEEIDDTEDFFPYIQITVNVH